MTRHMGSWVGVALMTAALSAQASLQARDLNGDGATDAWYDSQLDITWLRDWRYARTSGQAPSEVMTWQQAMTWVQGLSFGGYNDWRLPRVFDSGADGCTFSFGGGSVADGFDCGYNVLTEAGGVVYSELAHLFYVTLGAMSPCAPASMTPQVCTPSSAQPVDPQDAYAVTHGGRPFQTAWPMGYWTESALLSAASLPKAWTFYSLDQGQGVAFQTEQFAAVAVRDGDVRDNRVPEPAVAALSLLGLAAAARVRRGRPFTLDPAVRRRGSPGSPALARGSDDLARSPDG